MKVSGLAFLVFSGLVMSAAVSEAQSPEFRFQKGPDDVVLEYQLRPGFIDYGEPRFGLKLYGDGRTVATLPEHFPRNAVKNRGYSVKRRGRFETRLTPQEVEALLRDVEPAFLIDTQVMREERRQQRSNRARTDGGHTRLVIRLTDYRPAEGAWLGAITQEIEWTDVFGDAELYPGVAGIQALHEANKALPRWVFELAQRVEAEERKQ